MNSKQSSVPTYKRRTRLAAKRNQITSNKTLNDLNPLQILKNAGIGEKLGTQFFKSLDKTLDKTELQLQSEQIILENIPNDNNLVFTIKIPFKNLNSSANNKNAVNNDLSRMMNMKMNLQQNKRQIIKVEDLQKNYELKIEDVNNTKMKNTQEEMDAIFEQLSFTPEYMPIFHVIAHFAAKYGKTTSENDLILEFNYNVSNKENETSTLYNFEPEKGMSLFEKILLLNLIGYHKPETKAIDNISSFFKNIKNVIVVPSGNVEMKTKKRSKFVPIDIRENMLSKPLLTYLEFNGFKKKLLTMENNSYSDQKGSKKQKVNRHTASELKHNSIILQNNKDKQMFLTKLKEFGTIISTMQNTPQVIEILNNIQKVGNMIENNNHENNVADKLAELIGKQMQM